MGEMHTVHPAPTHIDVRPQDLAALEFRGDQCVDYLPLCLRTELRHIYDVIYMTYVRWLSIDMPPHVRPWRWTCSLGVCELGEASWNCSWMLSCCLLTRSRIILIHRSNHLNQGVRAAPTSLYVRV